MLTDFAPGSAVIMARKGDLVRVPVADLLPEKYRREL
jgi:hypothetical protein